ncbi:S41 family peptidase [Aminithiophilus ramosus]|uniref:S41 family peptidase n=2 Tax=Synergistales TaxID=649776 RepID=A0A9Q7F0P4_9BACT|nr:S41 family peptidase [Aminithiophilus ramosus]QTX33267.1 S41 family peptidase [Aminithiophilus ramosus]QVL36985.1 S41 family peptidase [Synergistota bacterium]
MWKRSRDIIAGILIGLTLAGGVLVFRTNLVEGFDLRSVPFGNQGLWLMKQARAILETYHVDADKQEDVENKLVHGALRGMVSAWEDPYTRYVDPDQMKQEEIEMQGEYGGLGIYIGKKEGRTMVISPIEGTPADRAGLKPLDEIVKVDDEVIIGVDQNEVVKKLRGAPGTAVTVWIRREGADELLQFDLVRENIQIHSVRHEVLQERWGYIRLIQFNQKTTEELQAALDDVLSQDVEGIVLDVRNNPGGLLNVAVDVADLFLDGGLVVGMRGRVERSNDTLYARPGVRTSLPLVVLINEGSASASEIVAGALRDRSEVPLVGKKSFGKGSVQTLFNLPDGSGLYVTIARYHTPNGVNIDHNGLDPDVEVDGEMTKEREEDLQLKRALEELDRIASPRRQAAS